MEKPNETRPRSMRKLGFKDVTFTKDDGQVIAIGGVTKIKQWLGRDGRARCLLETMDVDLAKSLAFDTVGRLAARFRDIYTRTPDEETTDMGWFRVTATPLYSAEYKGFASAKVRMTQETEPPPPAKHEASFIVDDRPAPVEETPPPAYRSFFFDDTGRRPTD